MLDPDEIYHDPPVNWTVIYWVARCAELHTAITMFILPLTQVLKIHVYPGFNKAERSGKIINKTTLSGSNNSFLTHPSLTSAFLATTLDLVKGSEWSLIMFLQPEDQDMWMPFSALSHIPSKLIVVAAEPDSQFIVFLCVINLVDLNKYLATPSNCL